MRRQRRTPIEDDYYPTNNTYTDAGGSIHGMEDFMQMERLDTNSTHRFENTIEAKIADGDTLQALALRFHCTVADIKRLNKIDKENEIYARKVVKIPITVHSVLLGTALPTVHKSGNNSPKHSQHLDGESERNIMRDPLKDAHVMLGEKLMVASVNSAGTDVSGGGSVNNVILNSKMAGTSSIYSRNDPESSTVTQTNTDNDDASPLLSNILDDEIVPHPRPIRGPGFSALDWSGSDCDMSWVCLFIVILALCFVIPLIYVIYLAEHPHHHNTTSH